MGKQLKKIYQAIPYSKIDHESSYNQSLEFSAYILKEQGHNVFSPIVHSHPISESYDLPGSWDFWSRIDHQFIDWCDEVWVLVPDEGHETIISSIGVRGELEYSQEKGKKIRFFFKYVSDVVRYGEIPANYFFEEYLMQEQ